MRTGSSVIVIFNSHLTLGVGTEVSHYLAFATYVGQHLQVAPDNRRGDIHHLLRFLVYLHECLAVPSVCRLHIGKNRLACEQLFLLRLVVAFQWRGFQDGIKYHVRQTVISADKGEAAAAFD